MPGQVRHLPQSGDQSTTLSEYRKTLRYSVAGYTPSELFAASGASGSIGDYTLERLAELTVLTIAPPDIFGAVLESITTEPVEGFVDDAWHVELEYRQVPEGSPPGAGGVEPTENDSNYTFEAGGERVNLQRSKGTTPYVKAGAPAAPDFNSGILFDRAENRFRGADAMVPTFGFAETHYQPAVFGTQGDINTIYSLVGHTNDTPFRGFEAGEVLFLGATGSKRGSGLWEISYRFECSPNFDDLSVGEITGIVKAGWDFLWVLWKEASGEGASFVAPTPEAVYIEQLYDAGSFASLGIGTV